MPNDIVGYQGYLLEVVPVEGGYQVKIHATGDKPPLDPSTTSTFPDGRAAVREAMSLVNSAARG
jgi:hypothetical protein